MIGGVCDLLDAAAALAGVPLISLYTVRTSSAREINPKAFADNPGLRATVIDRAKKHDFTQADFDAMIAALGELTGKGNTTAWRHVAAIRPEFAAVRTDYKSGTRRTPSAAC
jgi:hypothetical protein